MSSKDLLGYGLQMRVDFQSELSKTALNFSTYVSVGTILQYMGFVVYVDDVYSKPLLLEQLLCS
jgi:hypothetical protein